MSASSRMIAADLPPSSRLTRLSCSPHSVAMRRPTALDPVNDDLVHTGMAHQRLAHLGTAGKNGHHAFGQVQPARSSRPTTKRPTVFRAPA